MENQLDLNSLNFNQLKAIAKENNLDVKGNAKQPFIDAIAAAYEANPEGLIIPEFISNPESQGESEKKAASGLPSGSYKYQMLKKSDGDWKPVKLVILTESQAATLNAQTANSNNKYVKIEA